MTTPARAPAFHFRTPSSILVAGPSGSGKTVFTAQLVTANRHLFVPPVQTVHYCYGSWQAGFVPLQKQGVRFHQGVPTEAELDRWFPRGGLLVLDDLMAEGGNDKTVVDLFTRHSHHRNITVIYLCQDLFPPGRYAKSISRNVHYAVIFKNPRDKLGLRNLLMQAFPQAWKRVMAIFDRVTARPYGYMVLDLHPGSDDARRIYAHLLQKEGYTRTYALE